MINTRAERKLLRTWIILVTVKYHLVQIGGIDGHAEYFSLLLATIRSASVRQAGSRDGCSSALPKFAWIGITHNGNHVFPPSPSHSQPCIPTDARALSDLHVNLSQSLQSAATQSSVHHIGRLTHNHPIQHSGRVATHAPRITVGP